MPDTLLRFEKPLDPDRLQAVLEGASMPTLPVPSAVNPEAVRAAVDALDPTLSGSPIDTELIEPLHRALSGLTRRDAADMRVWHYIACVEFPQVVWMRWNGQVPLPGMIGAVLTSSLSRRFLGVPSLNGVSRNTFARLWWAAEALHDGDDYDMARAAIANQDLFQAIFERFFGIDPNAAVTCLERLGPESEDDRRKAARWLQQCLSNNHPRVALQREHQPDPRRSARQLMVDIVDRETRSRMMSRIRGKDTKPELALRSALWRAGYRGYRCHYARAPGRPDIAFVGRRIAVFVDGAFWHGHPDYFTFGKSGESWDSKIRRNMERDLEVNSELDRLGWTSIRIWDFEVLDDVDSAVARLASVLEER